MEIHDFSAEDLRRVRWPRWLRITLGALLDEGSDPGQAIAVAVRIAESTRRMGDQRIPSPSRIYEELRTAKRDGVIETEFTGENYSEIARRFRLSVRQVRRIIAAARDRERAGAFARD